MSKDSLNQGIDSEDLKTMVIDAGITLSPEQETELLLNPELKRAMHAVLWGEIQSTAKYRQHARLGENHSGTDNLFDDPNVDPIVASTPEENATVTVKKAVMKRRGIVRSFIASWFKSEDKRKKDQRKLRVTENLEPKTMLSATAGVDTDASVPSPTIMIQNSPDVPEDANRVGDAYRKLTPEEISLQDDFSSDGIDDEKWTVQLTNRDNSSSLRQENGKLNISGKSLLVTKEEYIPSAENLVIVEGEWTPMGDSMEMFYVNTRSSGAVDAAWGNATDGIQFSVDTFGYMRIKDLSLNKTIGTMNFFPEKGKTYKFHIEDNGSRVYLRINDSNGRLIAGAVTDTTTQSDHGHITLSNFGSRGYSSYDNVAIKGTATEVVPEVDDSSSDPDVAEPLSSDPQPTYEEIKEYIDELKAAILERGMNAGILEQSFLETFDTWDADAMATIWGEASVSDGKLYVGDASMVQLKQLPVRESGQEKVTTMHVQIDGSRFMWRSGATEADKYAGEAVDINAEKYVGISGPQGDSYANVDFLNGIYTIVETENDEGIKIEITHPSGKKYSFSYGLHEAGRDALPTLYSGSGVHVEDISIDIYTEKTLIEALGEAKVDLWSADRDRARDERRQEAFSAPGEQTLQERIAYLQDQINSLTLWHMSMQKNSGPEREMLDVQERINILEQQKIALQPLEEYIEPAIINEEMSEAIRYAKMFVEVESPQILHLRYRNPGESTTFRALDKPNGSVLFEETVTHEGGVADASFNLTVSHPKRDGQFIPVEMLDEDGNLLQSLVMFWDHGKFVMWASQDDFDYEEQGKLDTDTFDPQMYVTTDGTSITVRFRSPSDKTIINVMRNKHTMSGVGEGATATVEHTGGIKDKTVTFPMRMNWNSTGTLIIAAMDDTMNNTWASVPIYWDGATKKLTLNEPQDDWEEMVRKSSINWKEFYAQERAKISHSAMYVTPSEISSGSFDVQYMTNQESVYFEVLLHGEPGPVYRETVKNPAGVVNGNISFNMQRVQGGSGNGKVEIRMFSDDTKTEMLGIFTGNYERAKGKVSGKTNANWEEMQAGFPIYKTGYGETLEHLFDNQTSPLRMQSWNRDGVESDISVDASTAVTEYLFSGTLSSLDFSSMEGSAVSLFANVQIDGDTPVTARFFRGGKEVGSQVLNNEDQLLFNDEDGISAVIFESQTPVTFSLSNVNFMLNDGFDFDVSALSGAENKIIADAIKKDWGIVDQIYTSPRYERFLSQNNITQYYANGMGGPSAGGYYLLGGAGDTFSQYTLFTPSSVASSPSLGNVVYYNDDGLFNLPPEFYTLVSSTLIVHPGAPTAIAVQIASGQNVLVRNAATADDLDDLLQRTEDFDPQISVQKLYMGHHPDPGFHNGITEIQDGETPVLAGGQQFHALLTVNNDTGISDTVSIDAYVGSTNTDNRSFVGTYTVTMGAYQSYTLIVNATAPSLDGGTPELIFEVNGTLVTGKHGRDARASQAEVQARRQGFADRIDNLVAEQHGDDSAQRLAFRANAEATLGVTFDPIIVSGGGGDSDEGNEDEEEEGNEDGEGGSENPDTTVDSEAAFEEGIFQTIQDRVDARLAERLSVMTIAERAEARGLLRRKEDGTLDEYFSSLFASGVTQEAIYSVQDESGIVLEDLAWRSTLGPELDAYMQEVEFNEEEKNLFTEAYDGLADLLTLIQKGFDDVIAEYQYRIDTKSQELLQNENLSVAEQATLTAEIAAAGVQIRIVQGARWFVPETPEGLAVEAALSATGLAVFKKAPAVLRTLLTKADSLMGTQFSSIFEKEIAKVASKISVLSTATKNGVDVILVRSWEKGMKHALDGHIGKTLKELQDKFIGHETLRASTSFYKGEEAKVLEYIGGVLRGKKEEVNQWMQNHVVNDGEIFSLSLDDYVGYGIRTADAEAVEHVKSVGVYIRKTAEGEYDVISAYPVFPDQL